MFWLCAVSKKCFDCVNLIQVNVAHNSGMVFSIVDDRMGSYPSECVEKFLNLALRCCQDETDARPCMSEVVRELESIWHMMPESNTSMTDSSMSNHSSVTTPQTSSSSLKNHSVSQVISGSDLVSGVLPTIAPRWWYDTVFYFIKWFRNLYSHFSNSSICTHIKAKRCKWGFW